MLLKRHQVWTVFLLGILTGLMPFSVSAQENNLGDVQTAIMQNAYSEAESAALEFIAGHPDSPLRFEAHYLMGLSQLRQEEYAQARETFQDLIDQNPEGLLLDKTYLGLFDAWYMDEYYKEALKTVKTLLKQSPRSEFLSLIYLKLARANLKLGHWDEGKKYLHQIVVDFSDSLEYHVARQLLEEKQYFAVQVGAFLDPVRAQNLAQELNGLGEYAYILETKSREGQVFYRVRVGKLTVLKEARDLSNKLSTMGYPTLIYP